MIPVIVAGAVIGLGAHACASADNDEAKEKNNRANQIIDESNIIKQNAQTLVQASMSELAKEKTRILQGNLKRFVKNFSKISAVNFNDTTDLFEIAKFNKNEIAEMQNMVNNIEKVNVNDVVGGASGAALAVGAADMFAGGTLLGGTGISVGGLAGGAAVGVIAAPVFALTGIFSASEAAANLEKAKANLSKAEVYQDECETYSYLAHAVSERCNLYYVTLNKVDVMWFSNAVDQLELLVNNKRTFRNFLKNMSGKKIYTRQEMEMVASVCSLAKMIKTIIDTNILDNNGQLTSESEQVILGIEDTINSKDLSVKMPEAEDQQQIGYQTLQTHQDRQYRRPQANNVAKKRTNINGGVKLAVPVLVIIILFTFININFGKSATSGKEETGIVENIETEGITEVLAEADNLKDDGKDFVRAEEAELSDNSIQESAIIADEENIIENEILEENSHPDNNDNVSEAGIVNESENGNDPDNKVGEIKEESEEKLVDLYGTYIFYRGEKDVLTAIIESSDSQNKNYLNHIVIYDRTHNCRYTAVFGETKSNTFETEDTSYETPCVLSITMDEDGMQIIVKQVMYEDSKELEGYYTRLKEQEENDNNAINVADDREMNQDESDSKVYILPDSDTRYYTESELNGYTKSELRLARNEIYARHGRIFDSEDLNNYFESQSWYNGCVTKDEFDESALNDYEKKNMIIIKAVEDGK